MPLRSRCSPAARPTSSSLSCKYHSPSVQPSIKAVPSHDINTSPHVLMSRRAISTLIHMCRCPVARYQHLSTCVDVPVARYQHLSTCVDVPSRDINTYPRVLMSPRVFADTFLHLFNGTGNFHIAKANSFLLTPINIRTVCNSSINNYFLSIIYCNACIICKMNR